MSALSLTVRHRALAPLATLALLSAITAHASAQSITNLGVLSGDHHFSGGAAVSANGNVVGGISAVQFFNQTSSFLWTQGGGAQDIGAAPDAVNTFIQSLNADGSAGAGAYYSADRDHAFRWTASGGVEDLGALEGAPYGATAWGISADGNVVGGTSSSADGDRAFRWTAATGMQSIGLLGGGTFSWGFALSGNGQAITGIADRDGTERAYVWTEAGGMQALESVDGAAGAGFAISHDGTVVAGYNGLSAARWVNGSAEVLGNIAGGTFSTAYGISGNGEIVGGLGDNAAGDAAAFIWSGSLGMVDLNTYLPSLGIDLDGWTLTTTTGLSFDGSVIVGNGVFNGEERGWVVTIPAPGVGALAAVGGMFGARRRRR